MQTLLGEIEKLSSPMRNAGASGATVIALDLGGMLMNSAFFEFRGGNMMWYELIAISYDLIWGVYNNLHCDNRLHNFGK